jgi:hypothetical protein
MTFRYIALAVLFLLLAAYAIGKAVLDFILALWGLS